MLIKLIMLVELKNYAKYITTKEFNKLKANNLTATLKLVKLASKNDFANFVNKTDFDNKLLSFNKRINSNKRKHVLVVNELNELSQKKQKKGEAILTKRIKKRFNKWI